MSRIARFGIALGAVAAACLAAESSRPHIVFVTGDDEYRSEYTMPAVGRILEAQHGFRVSVAMAKPTPQSNKNIEGLEALETADIAVFYLRWRELPPEQMRRILAFVESGKPMVGLRTTTHAFRYPKGSEYEKWNDGFGRDIFGQRWFRHHGHTSTTAVTLVKEQSKHPILRGVAPSFQVRSWLYVVNPLEGDCVPLAIGRAVNPQTEDAGPQPVAWTKTYRGARVFFTTMGHPEDFQIEAFRRLLVNGILWAAGKGIPPGGAKAAFVGEFSPPPSGVPKRP